MYSFNTPTYMKYVLPTYTVTKGTEKLCIQYISQKTRTNKQNRNKCHIMYFTPFSLPTPRDKLPPSA